jgi:glycosyltransferase involved in cell wall biosynthesis
MDPEMNVTVILCTYNRCDALAAALDSVAASVVPPSFNWEVLIVDNNSKDQTQEVVDQFSKKHPGRFRYFFEPKQGKSHALNSGIREAHGEVLAFMDDDITVEPDWLYELVRPLAKSEWAGTGGRVYLPKDFVVPDWMAVEGHHSLVTILALFDLGPDPAPISKPPIGNNMAFRKSVFAKYGNFRTDLGPTPGSEIRYEDTEFGARVMRGGGKILYVPSAIVRHEVPERRLKQEYFLSYHFDYGRALIRERGDRHGFGIVPRPLISLANRLLNILPTKAWRWLRESQPQKRFYNKCQVWTIAGEITEICRRSLGSRTPDSSEIPGGETAPAVSSINRP